MQVSPNGLHLIQLFEQFRAAPYADSVGVWTVGWGHALTDPAGHLIKNRALVPAAMTRLFGAQTCTQQQADDCMRADLKRFEDAVSKTCPQASQAQFDAMVSLCFNVGEGNFEPSSVARLHNAGKHVFPPFDIDVLARKGKAHALTKPLDMPQAFAAWSNAGGQWSLGVFRRRIAEVMVYRGDAPDAAYKTVYAYHD